MKKTATIVVLILMLALSACGMRSPAAETPPAGGSVQIPNPWRDVTEAEAKTLCPGVLNVPEGAENVQWSVMETAEKPALVQLTFDLNGMTLTAREQANGDETADISGMHYPWTAQTEMTLRNWGESAKNGTCFRCIGDDEWADLCTWYDTEKGISYSLSVTAKDLDGFDLQAVAEALAAPAVSSGESGRQDGERFEAVIVIEGMEETVRYEHVRNDTLGFEMDYDYEKYVRRSEPNRERFISIWDDPQKPENYLELTYRAEDADTVAGSVSLALSGEYDILREARTLEHAGNCLYIDASNAKGNGGTPDLLQGVYIIPAGDGCLVAAAHYSFEAAEGFGRRFAYMLNTLAVTDRTGEGKLTDEQALSAIKSYCFAGNPDLEDIVNTGEYQVYWEIESSDEQEIVVLFRSYTGALIRYHIDPVSGLTWVTEFVPGITPEEQRTEESFNARDYLLSIPGTWQTASIGYEADGTAYPEYHVRFTDAEIVYGHMKDGEFVPDHADKISSFGKTAAGGFRVRAESANGVRYTYQTSEGDADVLEYYETWNEAEFPDMYRGGASLSRCR